MKRFMQQRVLPILLVVVLIVPALSVPAQAVVTETVLTIAEVIGTANDIKEFYDSVTAFVNQEDAEDWGKWHTSTYLAAPSDNKSYYTEAVLSNLAFEWNQYWKPDYPYLTARVGPLSDTGLMCVLLEHDNDPSVVRVLCHADRSIIVAYPADSEPSDPEGDNPARWIPDYSINTDKREMLSREELTNMATAYHGDVVHIGNYWMIYSKDRYQVLADPYGFVYSAWYEPTGSVTDQERPDAELTINGEQVEIVEGNQTNIDLEGMTITLPDGSINLIDQIIYDESTKTYHIDARDQSDTTINNYYTWNYHINYTSITYIGQTEEYNKYYEVYYELPDGRSSADLTKEDLEQLNLAIDVIPYARAADDVAIKALYHFDGDTRDASFWNYTGKFQWNKGASITYMDAAVFDGALYLDETEHDFSFVLPRFLVDDTFVMQWRYYQSATAAPVTDSYVAFGTNKLIQFNGESLLDGSGNVLAEMPIGSWNEIAIMRKDAAAYVYLNGLVVGQFILGSIITNKLDFHFGNEQQTFKYFDEFRLVTDEVYPIGSSYTPTAVPFDTNLTLVVPDGDYVVADEWKEFVKSDKAVLSFDFTQGEFAAFDSAPTFYNGYPQLSYGQVFTMITDGSFGIDYEWTEDGLVLTREEGSSGFVTSGMSGLCMSLSSTYNTTDTFRNGSYPNLLIYTGSGAYTWTYCTFTYKGHNDENYNYYSVNGPSLNLGCTPNNKTGSQGGNLVIYPLEDSITISRIELYVQEAVPADFSKYITHSAVSVMDPEQLRTPTLAVRTDLDITGYQIGGVRPSVPKKGQVWALVENQRITSIQIYNGQAWESCDGRIWTGERWIPASSYNIVTLQDMYDIVDATPDYEYIYTESGFWSWWQKSWNAFTDKLFSLLGTGGTGGSSGATGGSGSSGLKDVDLDKDAVPSDPDQEDSKSLWQFIVLVIDGGKSVVGGVRHLFSGVVSSVPETMDNITGAFDSGGVAVGLVDGTGADPDVSVETYSAAEGEVLDPWRYR